LANNQVSGPTHMRALIMAVMYRARSCGLFVDWSTSTR
jgi:hypothetical protein